MIHGFSKKQIQGFLCEIARLLKPDGKLAIVEIEKKEMPFGSPMELRFSPEELKEIVPLSPVNTIGKFGQIHHPGLILPKENDLCT